MRPISFTAEGAKTYVSGLSNLNLTNFIFYHTSNYSTFSYNEVLWCWQQNPSHPTMLNNTSNTHNSLAVMIQHKPKTME